MTAPAPLSSPMKNLLCVNPWITDFTAYDFWLKPLGLLSVASLVRENVDASLHLVDCLDRFHPGLRRRGKIRPDGRGHFPKVEIPKPEVLREVPRRFSQYGIPVEMFLEEIRSLPRPDAVLMASGMTYWYPGVIRAVELIRGRWGRVPIILGGLYPTLLPGHARRVSGADAIIQGPAERSLLPVLREILGDAAVRSAEPRAFADLPAPAWDLLSERSTLALQTSRGCPCRCSFCATPLLYPHYERRPVAAVVGEIERAVLRWGTRNFAFYDDALLHGKEDHLVPILEAVAERKLPTAFHTPNGLMVREIDDRLACLFRRAGVTSIYLSQESFDPELLASSCPKVKPEDFEKALRSLEKAGYSRRDIHVYLMTGLPGQELSWIRKSVGWVRRLGARPHLAFFSPVPGTPDYQKLVDRGILSDDTDPLLHNKLAFAYLRGGLSPSEFDDLRNLLLETPPRSGGDACV